MFSLTLDVAALPANLRNTILTALAPHHPLPASPSVQWDGAIRLSLSQDALTHLARYGLPVVRRALASSPRLTTAIAEILAHDGDPRVLLDLALNPRTAGRVLDILAENPVTDALTQQCLALHPHASTTLRDGIAHRFPTPKGALS
ncbi:hypothetical protein SAMN00768000_3595 [Sulfobacillus thermosulfidooxidans DSM 9293]|uniref:Leucine rich repeat variant n=3 Tax=Sulfobacillus thermosulfidooxidans TaxID=28034 RepID=A0A1W1WP74_SULTA|nr:MAG: hypothetical protein C7B47_16980 [Sulfobacillus thermosulfidooxidans]SMC08015.1 hypothetical protein SAMN00768000_3595 [Sulfobacillus thermosulfidooxidans DSM 9293]